MLDLHQISEQELIEWVRHERKRLVADGGLEDAYLQVDDLPNVAKIMIDLHNKRIGDPEHFKNKVLHIFNALAKEEAKTRDAEAITVTPVKEKVRPAIRERFLAEFGENVRLCRECGERMPKNASWSTSYCCGAHANRAAPYTCQCGNAELRSAPWPIRYSTSFQIIEPELHFVSCPKCGQLLVCERHPREKWKNLMEKSTKVRRNRKGDYKPLWQVPASEKTSIKRRK